MKSKRMKTFAALTTVICIGMILLWVASMGCMTYVLARRNFDIIQREAISLATDLVLMSGADRSYSQSDFGYDMLWLLCLSDQGLEAGGDLERTPSTGAVTVSDVFGNVCWRNRDFLRFEYALAEDWEARRKDHAGWAWIDLETNAELKACIDQLQPYEEAFRNWWNLGNTALRITGYLLDDQMIPVKIEYAEHSYDRDWPMSDWMPLYETQIDDEEALITVCTEFPLRYEFVENREACFQGNSYANWVEVLTQNKKPRTQWSLREYVAFDTAELIAPGGESYTVSAVAVYYPLEGAMQALKPFYVWTFVLLAVLTGIMLLIIRKNLIRPLEKLDAGFFSMVRQQRSWAEPDTLARKLEELDGAVKERNDQLRKRDNEIIRLNKSVDYAKKAEENRRQMVSAVAHELKTPLAIISGYTEGLQEHIAEEKRERYLQIIHAETQRMDGLVMEMLELSRLEAGKITLARDEFDLSALVMEVFGKLEKEMQRKQLQVEWNMSVDTPVYADEGRMEQVIRNLAVNAVRYCPEGGQIRVSTERMPGTAEFRIYNEAKPFSQEELEKVWEAFYRTDSSRHGKGTGLGLAITKNIVLLHGGSCGVRNWENGVEFSFRIPQKY